MTDVINVAATTSASPYNQTRDYLSDLYGDTPDGLLWIGHFTDGGCTGRTFTTPSEAAAYAMELDAKGGKGVYHRSTTLARAPRARGVSEDSAAVYYFALDADVVGPGHKAANLMPDRAAVDVLIREAGMPEPTHWVSSGGGYYPQWRFPEPIDVRDAEVRQHVEQTFARLSAHFIAVAGEHGWKLDNVRDLARVFRLPGTTNRKADPVVATVEGGRGVPVHLTNLARQIPAAKPAEVVPSDLDTLFQPATSTVENTGTWTREQAEKEITKRLATLATTQHGDGFNNMLNATALRVGRFVPDFLSEDDARERLERAVTMVFGAPDEQDTATIKSGLAAGMAMPFVLVATTEPTTEPASTARKTLKDMLLSREQLRNMPQAEPLIRGVLDLDSATWLIGQPGGFKSFVALDWACHVATGKPWRGTHVVKAGPVLYIVGEGVRGFGKRVDAWEKHYGAPADMLHVLPVPVLAKGGDGISPRWRELVDLVAEVKPHLVVIDTQARMTVGMEENNNSEMGVWVHAVDMVKQASQACVLVIHHTGRNGGDARGASALDGAQDAEWRVDRKAHELACTLSMDKNKDGDDSQRWTFSMDVVDVGVDELGFPKTSLVLGSEAPTAMLETSAIAQVELAVEEGRSIGCKTLIHRILDQMDPKRQGFTEPVLRRMAADARKRADMEPFKEGSIHRALYDLRDAGTVGRDKTKWFLMDQPEGTNSTTTD